MNLFPNGIKGLADTKWAGAQGQATEIVGVDYRTEPGIVTVNQAMKKFSPSSGDHQVNELCKVSVPVSDGSNLWFSSESGKVWREFEGTFTHVYTNVFPEKVAWEINNLINSGKEKLTGTTNTPYGSAISPDGTKMLIIEGRYIRQYTLSTPWDISTATYNSQFDTNTQTGGAIISGWVDPSGDYVFVASSDNTGRVYRYDMSTEWDISTMTYSTVMFTHGRAHCNVTFGGGKMFLSKRFTSGGFTDGEVYEYSLSSYPDISTASLVATTNYLPIATSLGLNSTSSTFIKADGTALFIMFLGASSGSDNRGIYQFDLSTPFDTTTASYNGKRFRVRGNFYTDEYNTGIENALSDGIFFKADGTTMIMGHGNFGGDTTKASTFYQFDFLIEEEDLDVIVLGAEEYTITEGEDLVSYIYYATKNKLSAIRVININNFSNPIFITNFKNGDDTYHPMVKQNSRLYIGDAQTICQVAENGTVTLESDLTVIKPERITALGKFDTDILIGTKNPMYSRVLRWDTESLTWYAEDEIFESQIWTFLHDDDFVYVIAGNRGRNYYYNGEKCVPFNKIPGNYLPEKSVKVNHNSVGLFLGVPIFGLSNGTGNPALQGLYSLGRFSKDYDSSMDLSYPVSLKVESNQVFDNIEIGAILIRDTQLMYSFKRGDVTQIDIIDWENKYTDAYVESMALLGGKSRSQLNSTEDILVDYAELPENTDIEIQYSKNYTEYVEIETVNDNMMLQIRAKETIPEIAQLTAKFNFVVDGNAAPRVENFHVNFVGEK